MSTCMHPYVGMQTCRQACRHIHAQINEGPTATEYIHIHTWVFTYSVCIYS